MGNRLSNIPLSIQPQSTQETTCLASKIAINSAKNNYEDYKRKSQDACPEETRAELLNKASQETNEYINKKKQELNKAVEEFNRQITVVSEFKQILEPTNLYLEKLDNESKNLEKDSQKISQSERTHRRKFLDNDPQGGVYALPGLRTYDDKIMLAFLVTYGAVILLFMIIILKLFGSSITFFNKIKYTIIALVVSYAMAYLMIYRYA